MKTEDQAAWGLYLGIKLVGLTVFTGYVLGLSYSYTQSLLYQQENSEPRDQYHCTPRDGDISDLIKK